MKILFLADLHLVPHFREEVLRQLQNIAQKHKPDAVVIAGDIADPKNAEDALKGLRSVFSKIPIAACMGNHDFWAPDWRERKFNPEDVLRSYWKGPAQKHQVTLIDNGNCDLGAVIVTGGYGHYDFKFAKPNWMNAGRLVLQSDYESGVTPDRDLIWNDMKYLACFRGAKAEAKRQAAQIKRRLAQAIAAGKPVLVAIHTIPFEELRGVADDFMRRTAFLNAYSGNSLVGKAIEAQAGKIDLLVCGHTHARVKDDNRYGVRCLNLGSDYGQVQGIIYNTTRKSIRWVKDRSSHV